MQESSGLKPDYFEDIKSFSKKSGPFHYKAIVQRFYDKSVKVKQDGSL